jgi:hypothetical protein
MVKSSRWRRRRGSATEVRAHALDRGPLALGRHAVGSGPNVIDLDAPGGSRTFRLHRPAPVVKLPTKIYLSTPISLDSSEGAGAVLSLHNTHRAPAHATEKVCAPVSETDRCYFARNFSAGLLRDWALKYMSKQGSFGTMSGHGIYINQQLTDDLVATNQGVVGSIPASRTI